jgi:hypothetical protein
VHADDEEGARRGAHNVDAGVAARKEAEQNPIPPGDVLPNYIKTFDDGRPRH